MGSGDKYDFEGRRVLVKNEWITLQQAWSGVKSGSLFTADLPDFPVVGKGPRRADIAYEAICRKEGIDPNAPTPSA